MKAAKELYKIYFTDRGFIASFAVSVLLLCASIAASVYAGMYATERASNAVTDIVLSNIRVYDVDGFFVYGPVVMWTFVLVVLLRRPNRFPFVVKNIALFTFIRSFFVILTHLGPFPAHVNLDPASTLANFMSGDDLFFSGHTGLPFLMALVFWDTPRLRGIFISLSVLFGATVLLGHLHYSIDVLAAFFITYTIYHLCTIFFRRDMEIFNQRT